MVTSPAPLLIEGDFELVCSALEMAEDMLSIQGSLLESFAKETGSYDLIVGYLAECSLAGDPVSVFGAVKYLGLASAYRSWSLSRWEQMLATIDCDSFAVQLRSDDQEVVMAAVARNRAQRQADSSEHLLAS